MEIGDRVLAVGAPFGLTGSVTAGIVTATTASGSDLTGLVPGIPATVLMICPAWQ